MTESIDQRQIRFADLLEKNPKYTPVRHHLPPMWNPEYSPELRGVVAVACVPTLNWGPKDVDADQPEGMRMVSIDANGAYVAAASSATFAHCALTRTGPLDLTSGAIPPGYLLVDAHPWQLGAPGSPFGSARLKLDANGRVWVPHTIYVLLRDLVHGASWTPGGHWPDATVYDSWTADPCKFTDWAGVVRDTRAAARIGSTEADQERIKTAYSQAVQMWATEPDPKGTPADKRKKKNKTYRPEWNHGLRGQHFANMWRRAYTAGVVHKRVPLAVRETDRIILREHDLLALLAESKSPIRLDETGLQLGTFKRAAQWYAGIEV